MKGPPKLANTSWSSSILSDWNAVDSACRAIRTVLDNQQLGERGFAVELLARECLANAVRHGNAGNRRKRVQVRIVCGRKWIRLEIEDQGKGFDWRRLRLRQPGEKSPSGRGLPIIYSYAGRVRFNRQGNQIKLWVSKTT